MENVEDAVNRMVACVSRQTRCNLVLMMDHFRPVGESIGKAVADILQIIEESDVGTPSQELRGALIELRDAVTASLYRNSLTQVQQAVDEFFQKGIVNDSDVAG